MLNVSTRTASDPVGMLLNFNSDGELVSQSPVARPVCSTVPSVVWTVLEAATLTIHAVPPFFECVAIASVCSFVVY